MSFRLFLGCLLLILPAVLSAQNAPYQLFFRIQEQAEALSKDGLQIDLRMVHSQPEDERPFAITVESAGKSIPVTVSPGGRFKIPALPAKEHERAVFRHNLEKGALSFTAAIALSGKGQMENGASISKVLEQPVKALRTNMAKTVDAFAPLMPEFRQAKIGIGGFVFPREKPLQGCRAVLTRDDKEVAVIDLSGKGPAVWRFKDYDPDLHSIKFEGGGEEHVSSQFTFLVMSGDQIQEGDHTILLK